jgi:hypothetical protein
VTMGGLWGEEDEGGGRTTTGGGEQRDKRCPMGMDEGVALASAAQMTARGGRSEGWHDVLWQSSSSSRDAGSCGSNAILDPSLLSLGS